MTRSGRAISAALALGLLALLAGGQGLAAPLPERVPPPPPGDNHYFAPDTPVGAVETAIAAAWRAASEPSLWVWAKDSELDGVTVMRISFAPAFSEPRILRVMFPSEGGAGVLDAKRLGGASAFGVGDMADETRKEITQDQAASLIRAVEQLGVMDQPAFCPTDGGAQIIDPEGGRVVFEIVSDGTYFVTQCTRGQYGPVSRLAAIFSQLHRFPPATFD